MLRELTGRQIRLLERLLDLCLECKEPVHYSAVAVKLGVSKFSAYDMLRLLENKGYVGSRYSLGAGSVGPGRSAIEFFPTQKAREALGSLVGQQVDEDAWNIDRQSILNRLSEGEGDVETLDELLERASDRKTSLLYCAQLIALLLKRTDAPTAAALLAGVFDDGANLESLPLLAGLLLGAFVAGSPNQARARLLLKHVRRYHNYVESMDIPLRQALAEFIGQVREHLCDTVPLDPPTRVINLNSRRAPAPDPGT